MPSWQVRSLTDKFEKLEDFVFRKMSETNLPGLSIAAIEDGDLIYARGFGFKDLSNGFSATPETLYCIGSVTKSFTCLAIMQLQEKGALSVEDPIEEYVPLKIRPKGEPIKIWHLMSHTSGIPALAYAEAVIRQATKASEKWLPISSYQDMLTFMADADKWVHSKPGERWFYLNEGYILLGYIIEKVSGEEYADYVKRHILEPLGMKRSYFHKEEVEKDPDVAVPYIVAKNGERIPSTYPFGAILSDGGLISSVVDMAKYVKMFINYGESDGERIASEYSIKEMMTPRIRLPHEPFISKGVRYYGYGLGIRPDFFGYNLIGHGGSVLVSTAYMGFIPEKGIGVVILANGSGYPLSYIGEYTLALLLGKDPMELPVVRYGEVLDELAGVYETYKGTMRVTVTKRGSLLQIERKDKYTEFTMPLIPVDIEGKVKVFHAISMDMKVPTEFIKEDEDLFLIYERYKLKKVGKI
ncbi:MAG: serine hydrolase [Thermoproteota archaeon]|nr:MAG: serine hydrolase [Candidatus Korarchaeota archaeon]